MMFSRTRTIPALMAVAVLVFLFNVAAMAEQTAGSAPQPVATGTPAPVSGQNVAAKAPAETPDARALSPNEISALNTQADSTAQNPQVQQMNVGMTINSTVVLSVLVALVIFAVLIAIL